MLMICKALVLLIVELIIEYLFGTMLTKLVLKREGNPGINLLIGFITYQAVFQILSISVTLTTGVLHHLTIAWGICLSVFVLLSIWSVKTVVKKQVSECLCIIKRHTRVVLFCIFVVVVFCWYTSINGESNADAAYYIALMTTSVETDSLFKYNVYTGMEMESLYLRRALATFEIHSAVISQMTQIHPLIVARVFRSCQNVILTSVAVWLCSNTFFWRMDKDHIEKSLLTTVVFWFFQMPFANTIYTPATFLLYRTYEAKAFTANFVMLLGLYLCVQILREKNYRYLIIYGFFLWGSMALSTTALVVAVVEGGIFLVPIWLQRGIVKKRRENLHAD